MPANTNSGGYPVAVFPVNPICACQCRKNAVGIIPNGREGQRAMQTEFFSPFHHLVEGARRRGSRRLEMLHNIIRAALELLKRKHDKKNTTEGVWGM